MDDLYRGWRRHDAPTKQCHSIKKPRSEALWVNERAAEAIAAKK
jgi:DNA adenine methylase